MSTTVTFYQDPTNVDYLMADVRLQFGDLDGSLFADSIIRTAIISAIRYLQKNWNGKYQVYQPDMAVIPQPSDVPTGYTRIATLHGRLDIPNTLNAGDVFRDPYVTFSAENFHLFESVDEQAVILAAVYILRKAQLTSNVGDFIAWGTEDIRYNNLGVERGLNKLLENDLKALNDYIQSRIAKPLIATFPITYIPQLTEALY